MKLHFTKMHGCGNDYIYIDTFTQKVSDPNGLSRRLSDRHKGVGGDGLVLIGPSDCADGRMRMFNADGSEGRMCGNAIRCVGKYLYDQGYAAKDEIRVETLSGIKRLYPVAENGKATALTVDMGAPGLETADIPTTLSGMFHQRISVDGREWEVHCVGMGSPHCVSFVEDVERFPLERIGPLFERAAVFPDRVNAEFVRVLDPHTLQMRVWERGSGETWACGTGSCAATVAATRLGLCPMNEPVTVRLRGGELVIRVTEETVFMTGEAVSVFEGEVEA